MSMHRICCCGYALPLSFTAWEAGCNPFTELDHTKTDADWQTLWNLIWSIKAYPAPIAMGGNVGYLLLPSDMGPEQVGADFVIAGAGCSLLTTPAALGYDEVTEELYKIKLNFGPYDVSGETWLTLPMQMRIKTSAFTVADLTAAWAEGTQKTTWTESVGNGQRRSIALDAADLNAAGETHWLVGPQDSQPAYPGSVGSPPMMNDAHIEVSYTGSWSFSYGIRAKV